MTREQYQAGLASLQDLEPDHALMSRLIKGYSALNVEYMRRALEGLYGKKEVPADDDAILNSMWAVVAKMLGQRAQMSNAMIGMRSKEDRVAQSKRIQQLQGKIGDQLQRADIYRATGELPAIEIDTADDQELPDDPGALYRKIHSLRTMIGQVKKELEELATLQESDSRDERIDVLHKRLKKLEFTLVKAKRKYES